MKTRSRLFAILAILLAFSLLASACGGDDDAPTADDGAAPTAAADDADDMDDMDDSATDDMDDAEDMDDAADDDMDDAEPATAADTDDSATAADAAPEPVAIGPPEVDTVRVCAAPSFTQMYAEVMDRRGFLSDRGADIEFVACLSGPAQAAALVSNQVDIALNTPDNMLGLRNADFDVVMFAQIVDTHFFDIVVSNNFGEIDCAEGDWECAMAALDGTRVGVVARGAAAEQIARQLLDSAGFDPDDSTYIATGLSGTTLAALLSDEIDWTITFEPGLTRAELDDIGYRPFRLQAGHFPAELDWPSAKLPRAGSTGTTTPTSSCTTATQWWKPSSGCATRPTATSCWRASSTSSGSNPTWLRTCWTTTSAAIPSPASSTRSGSATTSTTRSVAASWPRPQQFEEFAVGPDIEAILPEELVAETTEVAICQAPSFNGLTAQIAVEKGFLADRGVTGEFIQCPSGPANAAALIAGEVHFSINTPDNMLGIRNAGFDVVLFQQIQDKHFFDIIISENFGPIDCDQGDWQCTMGALEGTSVGVVARGAAAEQIARQLYDSAGFDPDGATYIATGLSGPRWPPCPPARWTGPSPSSPASARPPSTASATRRSLCDPARAPASWTGRQRSTPPPESSSTTTPTRWPSTPGQCVMPWTGYAIRPTMTNSWASWKASSAWTDQSPRSSSPTTSAASH